MIRGLYACVVAPPRASTHVRVLRCGRSGPDRRVWQVTDTEAKHETTSVTDTTNMSLTTDDATGGQCTNIACAALRYGGAGQGSSARQGRT